jgi:transposase
MVDLVRAGAEPAQLAQQFGPSAETIRNWVRQADRNERHQLAAPTAILYDELAKLRLENRRLREERDILAKAVALFARHTSHTSGG